MDTGLPYLASFFGCGLLGAVPIPLYPPGGAGLIAYWQETVERVMRQAGSRVLVIDRRLKVPAIAVADRFEGGEVVDPGALSEPGDEIFPPALTSDELAFIQYTSGTTALPKGVMIPHAALLSNMKAIAATPPWRVDDLLVGWLPLYHDMGLVGCVLTPLTSGIPALLMPPMLFLFRPRRWLWTFHCFRGTLSPAPNFSYALCVERIRDNELEGLDLSSWRVAYNGAEFIHRGTVERFTNRFTKYGFNPATMYPVYGMAETALAATFPVPGSLPRIESVVRSQLETEGTAVRGDPDVQDVLHLVGVGRPFPGHEILVIDEEGQPLPDRHQGEIVLSGPSLFSGYVSDAEATAKALRNGRFHTGDLGFLSDGDLFVCGRTKDLIIRGGRNLHPYDIEVAAESVAGVRTGNVAAFGVLDSEGATEELIVALESRVTGRRERDRIVDEVEHAVFSRIGVRPKRILVFPPQTLPKTSSGKTARAKVRQQYLENALRPGGRKGRTPLGSAVHMAGAYVRAAAAKLRKVPGIGGFVDRLLPRRAVPRR
jgi:acyl-CoA synthetase (AMP-forming)/AMP-acid ligase II